MIKLSDYCKYVQPNVVMPSFMYQNTKYVTLGQRTKIKIVATRKLTKSFYSLSFEHVFSLNLTSIKLIHSDETILVDLLIKHNKIKELILDNCDFGIRNLKKLFKKCTSLEKISIYNNSFILGLIEKNKSIKRIYSNAVFTIKLFDKILKQFPYLKHLGIDSVFIFDLTSLRPILETFENVPVIETRQGNWFNDKFKSLYEKIIVEREMSSIVLILLSLIHSRENNDIEKYLNTNRLDLYLITVEIVNMLK